MCAVAMSRSIQDADRFIGQAEASEIVDVRSRVSGFLQSIDFDDGQVVQEGALLATVEPDEYDAIHQQSLAMIELAKTKLELAEAEFRRAKKLIESGAVSQEEYDEKRAAVLQADASITVAEADAKRTALNLKYTRVLAPISGRIDRAMIDPGNVVTGGIGTGTVLTRIVNTRPIYINMDVDEASVLRYLRTAQSQAIEDPASDETKTPSLKDLNVPCQVQLQDEEGFPHEGVLDFLQTGIDASTGTIGLRARFENETGLLQDGMFVRVRIPVSEPYDAVVIPETAIGTDQTYQFAFVVDDNNVAERRNLKLGGVEPDGRVVLEGIQAGEIVIAAGAQKVRPGMSVTKEMMPAATPPTEASSATTPPATKETVEP